jgi:APA family basic amino acid/polyamine antiporter
MTTRLKRELTLYGLTMVAIGSCIGSGIFLTPSQIAQYLPSPLYILLVWTLGGVIALAGALTFAELGSMFPQAGGVYEYLKLAYGPIFGFLYGWSYLFIISSGAIAALAIAFATYLAVLVPLSQRGITVVAVGSIICVTLVNIFRVKAGEVFASVFTGLKLAGIAAIVVVGLFLGAPELFSSGQTASTFGGSLFNAFGLALVGVLWSYGGWQHATYLAGEAIDPRRTVPRALVIGALIVALAYVTINLAYLFLLPVDEIAASSSVAADAVETIFPFSGKIIAMMIAISVFGTAGIYTLSSPRLYYAMASDRVFFKGLAKVHPRFRTPMNAILLQSAWAIFLLFFWGTFEDVITYVVFTDWIFFCLVAISVFVFRVTKKDELRPYKTWGYPVTPMVFIVCSFLFVLNTLLQKPRHAWAGLILVAVGIMIYLGFRKFGKSNGMP